MKLKANHITILRIFLLPIPCYMVLNGGPTYYLYALFILILLGATDWLDGWIARRQGVTILGSLLDPIADKIFLAMSYITVHYIGIGPWWLVVAILFREFSITVLRSLTARAQINFKTSSLAKYKTAIQMGAAGFLLWITATYNNLKLLYGGLLSLFLGSIIFNILFFIKRKKITDRMISSSFFFLIVPLLIWYWGKGVTFYTAYIIIILITYISGVDYIIGLIKGIEKALKRASLSRTTVTMLESIIIPTTVLTLGLILKVNPWLLIGVITVELSVGGLDNLLSNRLLIRSIPWIWLKTILLLTLLLTIILQRINYIHIIDFNILYGAILVISLTYAIFEFVKYRHEYL